MLNFLWINIITSVKSQLWWGQWDSNRFWTSPLERNDHSMITVGICVDKSVFKYPFSKSVSCCIEMALSAPAITGGHFRFQWKKCTRWDAIYSLLVQCQAHDQTMLSRSLYYIVLHWKAIYSTSNCNNHSNEMPWWVWNSYMEKIVALKLFTSYLWHNSSEVSQKNMGKIDH